MSASKQDSAWGAGTSARMASDCFPRESRKISDAPGFVAGYAHVKAASAQANVVVGRLDASRGNWILAACDEIGAGSHPDLLDAPLFVGGGGTITNLCINEAIATVAERLASEADSACTIHPLDHVNASQSTNDTYPTAMALAVLDLADHAQTALSDLVSALEETASRYPTLLHLGRTCLQDALPLTAAASHRAQAEATRRTASDLDASCAKLLSVPLGGTAIGTGAGAPTGFRDLAIEFLRDRTGRPLICSDNMFDALANLDPYYAVAASVTQVTLVLGKIAADLRFLSSGPRGGIGEIALPAQMPGSSIMPGKLNPVIPEYVMQLSFRIRGAGHTIECAVAAGELELNVMEPAIAEALTSMLIDLTSACQALAERVFPGLTWNEERVRANLEGSLLPRLDAAAHEGHQPGRTPDGA